MKTGTTVSRRDFVMGSGAAGGAALVRLGLPGLAAAAQAACSARDDAAPFATLGNEEARTLEAFAARILPTTTTPGARDAGVIYFFDNVLGDQLASMLEGLRAALEAFQKDLGSRFPGAQAFADLDEADQDVWIAANENTPFFGMARMLTLMGFFAMSRYGGNRDNLGWTLIGFDGHGAAQPPFGFYDAEYVEENGNGP